MTRYGDAIRWRDRRADARGAIGQGRAGRAPPARAVKIETQPIDAIGVPPEQVAPFVFAESRAEITICFDIAPDRREQQIGRYVARDHAARGAEKFDRLHQERAHTPDRPVARDET